MAALRRYRSSDMRDVSALPDRGSSEEEELDAAVAGAVVQEPYDPRYDNFRGGTPQQEDDDNQDDGRYLDDDVISNASPGSRDFQDADPEDYAQYEQYDANERDGTTSGDLDGVAMDESRVQDNDAHDEKAQRTGHYGGGDDVAPGDCALTYYDGGIQDGGANAAAVGVDANMIGMATTTAEQRDHSAFEKNQGDAFPTTAGYGAVSASPLGGTSGITGDVVAVAAQTRHVESNPDESTKPSIIVNAGSAPAYVAELPKQISSPAGDKQQKLSIAEEAARARREHDEAVAAAKQRLQQSEADQERARANEVATRKREAEEYARRAEENRKRKIDRAIEKERRKKKQEIDAILQSGGSSTSKGSEKGKTRTSRKQPVQQRQQSRQQQHSTAKVCSAGPSNIDVERNQQALVSGVEKPVCLGIGDNSDSRENVAGTKKQRRRTSVSESRGSARKSSAVVAKRRAEDEPAAAAAARMQAERDVSSIGNVKTLEKEMVRKMRLSRFGEGGPMRDAQTSPEPREPAALETAPPPFLTPGESHASEMMGVSNTPLSNEKNADPAGSISNAADSGGGGTSVRRSLQLGRSPRDADSLQRVVTTSEHDLSTNLLESPVKKIAAGKNTLRSRLEQTQWKLDQVRRRYKLLLVRYENANNELIRMQRMYERQKMDMNDSGITTRKLHADKERLQMTNRRLQQEIHLLSGGRDGAGGTSASGQLVPYDPAVAQAHTADANLDMDPTSRREVALIARLRNQVYRLRKQLKEATKSTQQQSGEDIIEARARPGQGHYQSSKAVSPFSVASKRSGVTNSSNIDNISVGSANPPVSATDEPQVSLPAVGGTGISLANSRALSLRAKDAALRESEKKVRHLSAENHRLKIAVDHSCASYLSRLEGKVKDQKRKIQKLECELKSSSERVKPKLESDREKGSADSAQVVHHHQKKLGIVPHSSARVAHIRNEIRSYQNKLKEMTERDEMQRKRIMSLQQQYDAVSKDSRTKITNLVQRCKKYEKTIGQLREEIQDVTSPARVARRRHHKTGTQWH